MLSALAKAGTLDKARDDARKIAKERIANNAGRVRSVWVHAGAIILSDEIVSE